MDQYTGIHAVRRLGNNKEKFNYTGSPQVKISQKVLGGGYFLTHTLLRCESTVVHLSYFVILRV